MENLKSIKMNLLQTTILRKCLHNKKEEWNINAYIFVCLCVSNTFNKEIIPKFRELYYKINIY